MPHPTGAIDTLRTFPSPTLSRIAHALSEQGKSASAGYTPTPPHRAHTTQAHRKNDFTPLKPQLASARIYKSFLTSARIHKTHAMQPRYGKVSVPSARRFQ